ALRPHPLHRRRGARHRQARRLAGRPAARRRREHRGAPPRAEGRVPASAHPDAPARPRHLGLPAVRPQRQGAGAAAASVRAAAGRKDLSRACRGGADGGGRHHRDSACQALHRRRRLADGGRPPGTGSDHPVAPVGQPRRAHPGRVPSGDRPHPPDPGPRARGVRDGDCRRPGIRPFRRADAAPCLAPPRPARPQARDHRDGTLARPLARGHSGALPCGL
ncbi:MAG: Ribosomal large subunit pseudouridine synthase D, partial [uncultured Sphingomonas sp.]